MKFKKAISLLVAGIFIATIGTVSAFAYGHNRNRNNTYYSNTLSNGNVSSNYAVCERETCVKINLHTHNGIIYEAHFYDDGHDYHEYCEIDTCLAVGNHHHDGIYSFGHEIDDGHDYHDGYCNYSYCTETGYHNHNGVYCFSNNNNNNILRRGGRGCC